MVGGSAATSFSESRIFCHLFPPHCSTSFQQLAILWPGLKGFPFDPFEGHIPVGVNRVDLFDVLSLDPHDIPFSQALEFFIHLIAHPPLTLPWQIIVLAAGATRTKGDLIIVFSFVWDHLASLVGGDAERIGIMRFWQPSGFAQSRRL